VHEIMPFPLDKERESLRHFYVIITELLYYYNRFLKMKHKIMDMYSISELFPLNILLSLIVKFLVSLFIWDLILRPNTKKFFIWNKIVFVPYVERFEQKSFQDFFWSLQSVFNSVWNICPALPVQKHWYIWGGGGGKLSL
jgi:hypothetical protein